MQGVRRLSPGSTGPTTLTSLNPFQFMTSCGHRRPWTAPAPPSRRRQSLGSRGAPGVAQGRARGQAGRRGTGRLEQEHDPDPVPRAAARRGRLVRARGDRHGAVAAGAGVGDRRAAGRGGAPAARRRHRAQHGRRPRHPRAPRRRGCRQPLGRRIVLLAQLPAGGRLPRAPGRRGQRPVAAGRRPGRDHRPRRPGRVARRDAPGAHGRPAAPRSRWPHDGGHRLVPAGGAADGARRAAARRAGGDHPGARADRGGADGAPAQGRARSRWCSPRPRRSSGSATCA